MKIEPPAINKNLAKSVCSLLQITTYIPRKSNVCRTDRSVTRFVGFNVKENHKPTNATPEIGRLISVGLQSALTGGAAAANASSHTESPSPIGKSQPQCTKCCTRLNSPRHLLSQDTSQNRSQHRGYTPGGTKHTLIHWPFAQGHDLSCVTCQLIDILHVTSLGVH
jgi:hypothetical protein